MEQLRIGECLKEIRSARQLTLDDAARLTGVSKPMLGQIERGQSSPTINTLWKIATGLKVPLSALCRSQAADFAVADPGEQGCMTEENGGMRAYPLFLFDPVRSMEVFSIEFDAGVRHTSDRHASGVEEYVFVERGTLEMVIQSEKVTLTERQAIRFRADVPHAYQTTPAEGCRVCNMIFYPKD